jgi:hypothetical protein
MAAQFKTSRVNICSHHHCSILMKQRELLEIKSYLQIFHIILKHSVTAFQVRDVKLL